MDVTITTDADQVEWHNDNDTRLDAYSFRSLHVSMPGEARCNGDEEAGAEERCQHCGRHLAEEPVSIADDPENAPEVTRERRVVLDSYGEHSPEFCEANMNGSDDHEPELIPGSFANSARVMVGYDDSVTVTISVGDPRGAFAMKVSRNDDGNLFLSVPHPSDGFPHMSLTEVRPGYYRIGG